MFPEDVVAQEALLRRRFASMKKNPESTKDFTAVKKHYVDQNIYDYVLINYIDSATTVNGSFR